MEKLGYISGKNLSFEGLAASGEGRRLPDLAAELLARRPDVIFVSSVAAMMALANQHTTIPVVFLIGVDPIGTGLVESLARPGGYFTGLFNNGIDHLPKNLQLLRELLPQARRVAAAETRLRAEKGDHRPTAFLRRRVAAPRPRLSP